MNIATRAALFHSAALALALGCASGCGDSSPNPPSSPSSSPSVTKQETLEQLYDLPYVGAVEAGDEPDGVVIIDRERMHPGYTLFSVRCKAMAKLITEEGEVVNVWRDPGALLWSNIELLPSGDLITVGADPYPVQGIRDEQRFAMRLRWDGTAVWKKYCTAHHDITLTPRGELLTLTYRRRRIVEVHPAADLREPLLTRMTMDGDQIESISVFDAVTASPERYPIRRKKPSEFGGRTWVDLFHCNSVEWMHYEQLFERHPMYGPENVLFCSRYQNRIAIVNTRTRDLVWAWGRDELGGPHDASVLENGNILVFDNGLARGWSRVVELDPISGDIVWTYAHPDDIDEARAAEDKHFYSRSKGSSQRLPNGNTLVCNADDGEIFEVTRDGAVVWRYFCTETMRSESNPQGKLRASITRAYRYERDFIDGLRARFGETDRAREVDTGRDP